MDTHPPVAGPVSPVRQTRVLTRPLVGARVLVITGSYGAGHDAAAREVAERFSSSGCVVEVLDIVDLLPLRLGPLLRAAYHAQLTRCPESWEATLQGLRPGTRKHLWAVRILGTGAGRVAAASRGSDLVVSTHPFASQVLGRLRRIGGISCPVVTYLTDPSVHALWVAPGVDLHAAIHPVAAEQARALGVRTEVVSALAPRTPLVNPRSRLELGLPENRPVAVVLGGSLGVGELEATARDLRDAGVTPVVLCGRNRPLLRRLSAVPGVTAFGWCENVREVFAVADLVVQNAGGFMTLEAMTLGVPLLSYRPIPGHGRSNAEALEREGLAAWPRSRSELRRAVQEALEGGRAALLSRAPDLVWVVAGPQECAAEAPTGSGPAVVVDVVR